MNKPHIIGIAGKAGYGKSTISKLIQASTIERVEIISFADPVRKFLLQIFPYLTIKHFTDSVLKETPIHMLDDQTPRQLMQRFATDFARSFDENIWTRHAEITINELSKKHGSYSSPVKFIVFDDVRYENEVELIRDFNGTIIHLERTQDVVETPWWKKFGLTRPKVHSSETGVRDMFYSHRDFIIKTDEPLEKTKADVQKLAACRFDRNYEV